MNAQRLPNAKDIERWYATSFEEILGNREIVEYFSDAVRSGGTLANTLLTGDSRSGKTSAIKTLARTLLCLNLDAATIRPCGSCASCTDDLARQGNKGIFAHFHVDGIRRKEPVHFVPIDCTQITDAELRELLFELQDYDGKRIVYLDEIHRLQRRGLDELLLKPLEERNYIPRP